MAHVVRALDWRPRRFALGLAVRIRRLGVENDAWGAKVGEPTLLSTTVLGSSRAHVSNSRSRESCRKHLRLLTLTPNRIQNPGKSGGQCLPFESSHRPLAVEGASAPEAGGPGPPYQRNGAGMGRAWGGERSRARVPGDLPLAHCAAKPGLTWTLERLIVTT